jgi:hypothetical protein
MATLIIELEDTCPPLPAHNFDAAVLHRLRANASDSTSPSPSLPALTVQGLQGSDEGPRHSSFCQDRHTRHWALNDTILEDNASGGAVKHALKTINPGRIYIFAPNAKFADLSHFSLSASQAVADVIYALRDVCGLPSRRTITVVMRSSSVDSGLLDEWSVSLGIDCFTSLDFLHGMAADLVFDAHARRRGLGSDRHMARLLNRYKPLASDDPRVWAGKLSCADMEYCGFELVDQSASANRTAKLGLLNLSRGNARVVAVVGSHAPYTTLPTHSSVCLELRLSTVPDNPIDRFPTSELHRSATFCAAWLSSRTALLLQYQSGALVLCSWVCVTPKHTATNGRSAPVPIWTCVARLAPEPCAVDTWALDSASHRRYSLGLADETEIETSNVISKVPRLDVQRVGGSPAGLSSADFELVLSNRSRTGDRTKGSRQSAETAVNILSRGRVFAPVPDSIMDLNKASKPTTDINPAPYRSATTELYAPEHRVLKMWDTEAKKRKVFSSVVEGAAVDAKPTVMTKRARTAPYQKDPAKTTVPAASSSVVPSKLHSASNAGAVAAAKKEPSAAAAALLRRRRPFLAGSTRPLASASRPVSQGGHPSRRRVSRHRSGAQNTPGSSYLGNNPLRSVGSCGIPSGIACSPHELVDNHPAHAAQIIGQGVLDLISCAPKDGLRRMHGLISETSGDKAVSAAPITPLATPVTPIFTAGLGTTLPKEYPVAFSEAWKILPSPLPTRSAQWVEIGERILAGRIMGDVLKSGFHGIETCLDETGKPGSVEALLDGYECRHYVAGMDFRSAFEAISGSPEAFERLTNGCDILHVATPQKADISDGIPSGAVAYASCADKDTLKHAVLSSEEVAESLVRFVAANEKLFSASQREWLPSVLWTAAIDFTLSSAVLLGDSPSADELAVFLLAGRKDGKTGMRDGVYHLFRSWINNVRSGKVVLQ